MAFSLDPGAMPLYTRAAVAGLAWLGGLALLARTPALPRRRAVLVAMGALLTGSAAVVSGLPWRGVLGPEGLGLEAQWLLAGALVMAAAPRRAPGDRLWSFLPLLAVGWQGAGAALAAVTILATGALERGQPRAWALAAGLGLFTAALGIDHYSLWLWGRAGSLLSLGADPASLLVDGAELAARLGGWAGLLGWVTRGSA